MATLELSILNGLKPDTSGDVFYEPYSIKATNDVFDHLVLIFNPATATRLLAHGLFHVPQNYVGTAVIVPVWTSTATTGNAVFDFQYRAISGNDTESLDQATVQETVTVTDAAPSAAHERLIPTMSLTSANLTAGDTVEFAIVFDDVDASNTIASAAILHDLIFRYSDA